MLDNYIKKIEELILPEYYDRNNYKEKIILEDNNNNKNANNNNNLNSFSSNTQQNNKIITSNIDSPILKSYQNSDINNNTNINKPKQISSIKIEKLSNKNSKIENINYNNYKKNNNIIIDKNNNNNKTNNNDNDNINNDNSIENERKEELNKMKQENLGKLQNPEFEIISNSNNNTNSNVQNNSTIKNNSNNNNNFMKINDKIYTQNDILNLLEKIKSINIKNMSYRYEMEKYKNKIIELNKTNSDQKEEIEKLEKEKENLTQYLLKLEKLIRGQKSLSPNQSLNSNILNTNSSNSNINKNRKLNVINNNNKNIKEKETIEMKKSYNLFNQSNIDVSIGGNNPYVVITDVNTKVQTTLNNKKELKNFLIRINKENLKLKNFQKKVFELSKNYDDLNSNLEETINKFTDLLNNNNDDNNNVNINKAEFLENYKILCEQVNKTLELKQNEYNTLLDGKDEALYLLQEELFITSNELEDRKRDRINEQKIINSLQIEINDLNEKLDNNNNNNNFYNSINSNNNNNKDDKNLNSLRNEIEAQKMTIPAKQVVNNIIKKIEKNFNMEDESNILLLNNINNSIK